MAISINCVLFPSKLMNSLRGTAQQNHGGFVHEVEKAEDNKVISNMHSGEELPALRIADAIKRAIRARGLFLNLDLSSSFQAKWNLPEQSPTTSMKVTTINSHHSCKHLCLFSKDHYVGCIVFSGNHIHWGAACQAQSNLDFTPLILQIPPLLSAGDHLCSSPPHLSAWILKPATSHWKDRSIFNRLHALISTLGVSERSTLAPNATLSEAMQFLLDKANLSRQLVTHSNWAHPPFS